VGYPIVRSGVALFIAQYQLLVEEACSGMNSIVGLIAISLFYIYMMHRASLRYALVLVAMVLPIAIAANLIRVMALVLITYHWGDAAAQGFLHVSAGLILFTLALALIFATDALFQRILHHKRVAAQ
jgi:exosortase